MHVLVIPGKDEGDEAKPGSVYDHRVAGDRRRSVHTSDIREVHCWQHQGLIVIDVFGMPSQRIFEAPLVDGWNSTPWKLETC